MARDGRPMAVCFDAINSSLILLWLGVWYFRRTEKTFADVI